jgi:hypothetical protein
MDGDGDEAEVDTAVAAVDVKDGVVETGVGMEEKDMEGDDERDDRSTGTWSSAPFICGK